MEKIKIGKGEVLHKKGDVVKSLEIILAGTLQLTDGNGVEVRLDSGSLVGAVYQTGIGKNSGQQITGLPEIG